MRQYTNKEQTRHLIELGFPKPKGWGDTSISNGIILSLYKDSREDFNYSIGELISFLVNPTIEDLAEIYRVEYDGAGGPFLEKELIDALYYACIDSRNNNTLI